MSKLINEFKNIHEGWEQSREAQDKINAAKTQIAEMLEKPQFRKFIVDKILANYRDDQIKMLEDRRKRLEQMANGTTSYSCSTSDCIFDPELDKFEIHDIKVSRETRQIIIYVEDLKERGYLGITGMWIPKVYDTNWISLDELEKAEDC
jgi:hypothetical protein